ncbi:ORF6C domain-containing protein [Vagococcus fluvialis]|uniref:ORF6N domain-containing protein n=1 Tax=Vagococcus fluvialis TaxID=2738 RepID=UPI001A8F32D3|nr:ORF6N domain-containing protein [Vagococcus fluvialis]MBO0478753.1 ORF6C domain-containing protein [Vagococcus fluvialis]MBO0484402.1 ORF6C domain-containing protein [Vagococcus fluvialis]
MKLQIIELENQRILTTEQLAEFYEATTQQIKTNFNSNKDKFVEGKHYYRLEGEELKEFKDEVRNTNLVGKNASQLILYTKQGASRHSKMLGTEKAWDMFDELEENYFNPKQQQLPTNPMEILELTFAAQKETNERVDAIEDEVKDIKENQLITTEDKTSIDRMVKKKVYSICKDMRLNNEAKKLLFADLGSSIKQLFNVPHRGRIRAKDFFKVVDFISTWEPNSVTKATINDLNLFDDIA